MTPTRAKAGRGRDDAERKTKRAMGTADDGKTLTVREKGEGKRIDDLPSDGRETMVRVSRTGRVT